MPSKLPKCPLCGSPVEKGYIVECRCTKETCPLSWRWMCIGTFRAICALIAKLRAKREPKGRKSDGK